MPDTADRVRWGRDVAETTLDGHPVLMYVDRPRSVADFLRSGHRWARREFMVQGSRRLTFEQHEQAVARVARRLADLGVGTGSRVVLLGFNSIEWVVGFWATSALGATAVLANAWWSDHEVAEALALVEPDLVISDREVDWPRLSVTEVRALVDSEGPHVDLPSAPRDEESLAVIMFSSGTTGAPKGVLMSQRSIVANIQNLLLVTGRLPHELPDDHPGTVSLLAVPMFHLSGVQVCVSTLLTGGRLVLLEGRFDPVQVLQLIQQERVRSWGAIPTMVSRVLDHPDFGQYDTSSVTSIPMGGAAVTSELRTRVSDSFSGLKSRASSLYGLTEAGGLVAAGSGPEVMERPGCVGRALPVVELRIANPNAEGEGEIRARSPAMTNGYLGDDHGVADAEGWISTGDLGRIDEDGWLYLTGRIKDIIIRAGENIACAHVEQAVLSHPAVLEAVAVALPHDDLGEEVGVALVLRPGASLTPDELSTYVAARLASYERPSKWWSRDAALPTNASGKILRREVRDDWVGTGASTIWRA